MSSTTASFCGAFELQTLLFFSPVQENCISLPGSNSSGNPSASSVITGLLRQSTHSALTVESRVLRSALFVRWWLRRTFKIFSVFLFPLKTERLKPLALVWVPLTLCLLGLSSWFWKARVSGALYLQLDSQWSPSCPCFFFFLFFFPLTCDQGLILPNQYEQDRSTCCHNFSIHLLKRLG